MRRSSLAVALAFACAAACGPKDAPTEPELPPTTLIDLAWLEGEWDYDGIAGAEYWVQTPAAVWGFILTATTTEMNVVDVGRSGAVQLWPQPDGGSKLVYTLDRRGDRWATFSSSAQNDPTAYTYERVTDDKGDALVLTRHTLTGPRNSPMRRAKPCAPVHELVAAESARGNSALWTCRSPHGEQGYAASVATSGTTSHATVWMYRSDEWQVLQEDRRP